MYPCFKSYQIVYLASIARVVSFTYPQLVSFENWNHCRCSSLLSPARASVKNDSGFKNIMYSSKMQSLESVGILYQYFKVTGYPLNTFTSTKL